MQGAPTRWALHVGAYIVSGIVAAALLGWALGTLSGALIPPDARRGLVLLLALFAAAYGVTEVAGRTSWIPTAHGSVPQTWWREWGTLRAAAAYGGVLSIGFTTVVRYPSFWVVLIGASIIGGPAFAATVMVVYAIGRTASLIVGSARIARGATARAASDFSTSLRRKTHSVVGVALILTAVSLLVSTTALYGPPGI